MKRFLFLFLAVALASASCTRLHPHVTHNVPKTALVAIDSLLWTQPDSAFVQLQDFDANHAIDSLDPFNRHYFHLLLSELLYKNYCEQSNRSDLLNAVDYFDSLVEVGGNRIHSDLVFLDARVHYIDGVGYYEQDSLVPACEHYLKALELMEEGFAEKELIGKKAQFMALSYTRLMTLFSYQYLPEQAVYFGKSSLSYYSSHDSASWQVSWILEEIGSHYNMLGQLDSASYYYDRASSCLNDTTGLLFRDITVHKAYLAYETSQDPAYTIKRLREMLSMSESQKEYYVRCLVIGDVFFQEQQYDSALVYLDKVYRESESTDARRQAAEWLVKISKLQGLCSDEYTDFLVPFTNLDANQSETKTMLAEHYSTFLRREHDIRHQQEIARQRKTTLFIVGAIVCLLLAYFVVYQVNKQKKRRLENLLLEERKSHELKQKAMSGRLVERNETLRLKENENKKLRKLLEVRQNQITWSAYEVFMSESICQSIVEKLEDKQIKREAKLDYYPELQLTSLERSQLEAVIARHFDGFDKKLTALYPKITRSETCQCHLCLLNLRDVQIAALMHNDYSTVKRRSDKLRKAFSTRKTLQSFLLEWVL